MCDFAFQKFSFVAKLKKERARILWIPIVNYMDVSNEKPHRHSCIDMYLSKKELFVALMERVQGVIYEKGWAVCESRPL